METTTKFVISAGSKKFTFKVWDFFFINLPPNRKWSILLRNGVK